MVRWLSFGSYAIAITLLYRDTLDSPLLLGFRDFLIIFLLSGLGGLLGTGLFELIAAQVIRRTTCRFISAR